MLKILVFSGVLIAVILKLANDFDLFKSLSNVNTYANCKYLKQDMKGPEDMARFNKSTIIIGSGNFQKVFSQGKPELEQSGIYAILNSHKKDYNVVQLNVQDFPSNIALYIHGINIRRQQDGDYLFVVNHAYGHGSERIEVFSISEHLELKYIYSIIMGQEFNGILNDLIVIKNDRFLVTTWFPLPDPPQGRGQITLWHKAKTFFYWLTKQKTTYVYDCKFKRKGVNVTPQCQQLSSTGGIMLNGITWNKNDTVWVADSVEKGFTEYKINEQGLQFVRFVNTYDGIDNIDYQEESNSLTLGLVPRLYNYFQLEHFVKTNDLDRQTNFEYWGAVGQYDLNKNELNILAQNRYLSKGVAGGILSGDNLYLSSWCDISVMVCQKI